MSLLAAALLVHAAATLAMTGVIWLVQLVQYPLLAAVGEARFVAYHRAHMRRITWLVAPLMALELAAAVAIAALIGDPLALTGLALCGVVWSSTWLVQVPQHTALTRGFDAAVHARLVRGNWLRTVAWTARAAIALALLGEAPA